MNSIEAEARKLKFRLAAAALARAAGPAVRGPDRSIRPDQSALGEATADSIDGLRYAEVGISVEGGICHFEATTRNKDTIHIRCRGNQVDETFATFGIDEYLQTTLKDPGKVRNEVRQACRHTGRKHPPILQETLAAPPRTGSDGSWPEVSM